MVAGQFAQPHRATGVKLVGGDADLRAETEFAAVVETGRGVVEDARRIDRTQETFRGRGVGGDDAVAVVRTVFVDVVDRFFLRADDFDLKDQVEILGAPVLFGRGDVHASARARTVTERGCAS